LHGVGWGVNSYLDLIKVMQPSFLQSILFGFFFFSFIIRAWGPTVLLMIRFFNL